MLDPLAAVAVKLTRSLLFRFAEHVPEATPAVSVQLNCGNGAPVLVTEPLPLPENASVRVLAAIL